MNEAEALAKYDKILWYHVHALSHLTHNHAISLEDLIQEARLAFLLHIRAHDESMWGACALTIRGALFDYARRNYPLSVSRYGYRGELDKETMFISGDEPTIGDGLATEDDGSDIDLRSALDKLTERERALVLMRLEGLKVTEISERTGRSHQVISYRLKAIRRKMIA